MPFPRCTDARDAEPISNGVVHPSGGSLVWERWHACVGVCVCERETEYVCVPVCASVSVCARLRVYVRVHVRG